MYKNITEKCKSIIAGSSRTFAASFVISGKKYSDIKKLVLTIPSTANGMVSIGGTISNSVEIITEKVDVQRGQKLEVLESVKLGTDEYEDIPMGHFKITSAKTRDSLTTIVASGPLSTETNLGYFSELVYPATTVQMLTEISASIGVEIETSNLEEIYVQKKPEGYTHREVIGFIAGIHAMNAIETRSGTIAFKWYTDCDDDIFTDKTDSPELSNELYVVTKFECATGSDTWSKGLGFTGIVISNPMMTEEMAESVWNKLSGFSYRPGSFNIKSGAPCVDPWDRLLYGGERVISTELQYVHDGGLQNTYKSSGETESSTRYKGPMATALDRYYAELLLVKNISADYMTIKEADIRYAKIDEMDVIEANITKAVIDTIDGRYASIEYIQTNYASILKFEALEGRIDVLQTNMLTSDSAIIKEMQSQITKTETLIFGAGGGTSIQTEFSNSVIAVLGEAQIKSAMIESVSAYQVTAGTIYTDNVTIQSKDGKTLLKDNTMQISDGNRTRVQIGKDARNDYSINVWDASGNIMFSKGGITEHAIKDAIIRDDMVSENASINASKLDIDSLFTEINGSSNTIKSTRVYCDSEKQTLDVVFNTMTTSVDGLKTTQSSQGTQIAAIQGQITSKVWQSDINKAVDEVGNEISTLSTKYTTLNQTIDGLSSTVGSHTTTINSLGAKVTAAESSIEQLSNEISLKVNENGVIGAINLSSEEALIQASKINLVGAVTFSSLDSSIQSKINTANSMATEALEVANSATPFIMGTQTTATGTWTGVAPFSSLSDGQQITYWLPYAGNGNASLNLTLANGSTTGAVNCYYGGSTRLTTHYTAGSAIRLTYRKNVKIGNTTYTGWWADANYTGSDTYDRVKFSGATKASATITAGNIIVGDSSGYHHLKTGDSFDISYPILYAASNISSNSTGNNNYLAIPFSVATTQSITLTAYKNVYIKGILDGTTFIPVSTAPLTQTEPTSDDGFYYILLGRSYSTTAIYLVPEHPLYRYKNGGFKTTAQIASEIAAWAWSEDVTYIDGGKIYVNEVFAQEVLSKDITATGNITATNLLITGNSVFEGQLNAATGSFEGSIKATGFTFYDNDSGIDRAVQFLPCGDIQLQITDNTCAIPTQYTSIVELMPAGGLLLSGRNMVFYDWGTMSFTGDACFSDTLIANKVVTSAGVDLDKLNSDLNNLVFVKAQTRDNLSVASGYDYFTFTDLPSISGYTRIANTVDILNATSGGANASYVMMASTHNLSGCVQVDLRNWGSNIAKIKISVTTIYIKDSMISV